MAEPRVALNVHELALVSTGGRQLVHAHPKGWKPSIVLAFTYDYVAASECRCWGCCARRAAADGYCAYQHLQRCKLTAWCSGSAALVAAPHYVLHCTEAALHSLLRRTLCCTVARQRRTLQAWPQHRIQCVLQCTDREAALHSLVTVTATTEAPHGKVVRLLQAKFDHGRAACSTTRCTVPSWPECVHRSTHILQANHAPLCLLSLVATLLPLIGDQWECCAHRTTVR